MRAELELPVKPNGLYAAVAWDGARAPTTYGATWLRDTVHIAEAQRRTPELDAEPDPGRAARTATTLLAYFEKHARRFDGWIEGTVDRRDPMQRPHVRFDGDTLEELPEEWSHAQNDAIGATLWFSARALARGEVAPTDARCRTLWRVARYLGAIDFARDRDSGHWEEYEKRSASSIGVALAGLRALADAAALVPALGAHEDATPEALARLIARGRDALAALLPDESRDEPDPRLCRRADAALLFLIAPFEVVDDATADRILARVREELEGAVGIRRYRGDSYWMAGYPELRHRLPARATGAEVLAARDALFVPGTEAEWCLFDPLLSVIHGRRYQRTGDPEQKRLQAHHYARALAQLTTAEHPLGPGLCPEAYFLETTAPNARWLPNENTPLLWTVAHLRLAVAEMARSTREG